MRDAECMSTIRVTLTRGALEHRYVLTTNDLPRHRELHVPLVFGSDSSAAMWFRSALLRERLTDLTVPISGRSPEGLLRATFESLGVDADGSASAGAEPSSATPSDAWADDGPTPSVPVSVGPGTLVNDRNGSALPFERIRFGREDSAEAWTRAGETFNLFPIGGPRLPLELLAPPRIDVHHPGPFGTGLVLETRAGTLRTRAVTREDVVLLTRLGLGRTWLAPPSLSTAEVEDLLLLAAQAGARVRMRNHDLDLESYRHEVLDIERYEVLLDADGGAAEALRHRIRRARGGSTLRVASHLGTDGWLGHEESLVLAAEQGWTRGRTRAVRPTVAHHFVDVEDRPLAAWFVGLCAEGVYDWEDVDDEHRPGVLAAAMAWTEAEETAAIEQEEAEEKALLRTEKLAEHLAAWRAETGQLPLGWQDMHRLVELVDPSPPSEDDEFDGLDLGYYDADREYEARLEEAEEASRWWAWIEDAPDDAPSDCPVHLETLVDRCAPFASIGEDDALDAEAEDGEDADAED
jgi:hypothetical protein